jgi:hypothetical protein
MLSDTRDERDVPEQDVGANHHHEQEQHRARGERAGLEQPPVREREPIDHFLVKSWRIFGPCTGLTLMIPAQPVS